MPVPDPLYHEEAMVEQDLLTPTPSWYSWFTSVVEGIRADNEAVQAEIVAIKARLDALEGP